MADNFLEETHEVRKGLWAFFLDCATLIIMVTSPTQTLEFYKQALIGV